MEELKSLNSTQQSVACALALQMVAGGEINIIDLVREKTASAPLTRQKVATVLDSASGLLSALGSFGGSGSSNTLGKLANGVLSPFSKMLTGDKEICCSFIQNQFGTGPSDLHILGVSNPLLRNRDDNEEAQDDDDEPKEAMLTDVFPTNSSRTALLSILRKCAQLDPNFKETADSTINKVVAAFD